VTGVVLSQEAGAVYAPGVETFGARVVAGERPDAMSDRYNVAVKILYAYRVLRADDCILDLVFEMEWW
jgi:hypothetical protein